MVFPVSRIPCHLLFQFYMGYYYGKARVTKKPVYHVLSLLVPILWHTVFDMFIVAIQKTAGPDGLDNLSASLAGKTTQQLMADPKLASMLAMVDDENSVILLAAGDVTLTATLHNGKTVSCLIHIAED